MSKLGFNVGVTFSDIVMLDYDNRSFEDVEKDADKLLEKFDLRGYIVMKTREDHYHVVFDRILDWGSVLKVLDASNADKTQKWMFLRYTRENLTLRVAGGKGTPRLIFTRGTISNGVKKYLRLFSMIKKRKGGVRSG